MKIPVTSRPRARIEIVPLIDIVFFLLATFVMVSLSMIKNQGVPVSLPRAASRSAQSKPSSVTITVKKDGAIYLDKTKMPIKEMVRRLRSLRKTSPDAMIVINGDKSSQLGDVVKVLDKIRYIGFGQVSIRTRK